MDNLIFEKVWQDDDFYEITIKAKAELITASVSTYVQDNIIDDLSAQINDFLECEQKSFIWEVSKKGDGYTPYVSLEIFHLDKLGHIRIEIFIEINDGGSFEKHNCCFYVDTELGLLEVFSKNLKLLNEPLLGTMITLNPEV